MRFLVAATVLMASAGCYRVKPVWEPEQFLAHAKPDVVYLRMRAVPPVGMLNPRLEGDSLRGSGLESGRPVSVAWADVVDVYAKQIDGTRTAFGVASMTILSGLVIYAFVQSSDGSFETDDCQIPAGSYDHDLDPECSRPQR